ncbi:hypothetical protein [Consotaella aegiceratis]|uniref:hypothetical protein n=1 Tax=Consotaella aegiceratis TaxID=3097961 RepID=UPI002F421F64
MVFLGLVFLLGVLVASFAALLIAPLVWRKAQHFAWREFEAAIPTTSNEARAQVDAARARAAMTVRRQEIQATETLERATRERAAAGRIAVENADLRTQARNLERRIDELEEELAALRELLASRENENERLSGSLQETRDDLAERVGEIAALEERLRELAGYAEERKMTVIALEAKLEQASDELRTSERRIHELQDGTERLRSEAAGLDANFKREKSHTGHLGEKLERLAGLVADGEEEIARLRHRLAERDGEPAAADTDAPSVPSAGRRLRSALARDLRTSLDSAEEQAIRERIGDIAARVIRLTALAEGPSSPLSEMMAEGDGTAQPGQPPSLAERVRLLAERDRQKLPPPGFRRGTDHADETAGIGDGDQR